MATRLSLAKIVTAAMLLALPACASAFRRFTFEFGSFDANENKGIEILDWQYGNSRLPYTRAPEAWLATGHIPQSDGATATFPTGDFLHVKWCINSTGKVFENSIDLGNRLPFDMNGKIVHYSLEGAQIYVYLIEGLTSKQLHSPGVQDCPVRLYEPFKCSRIYPDQWSNL